MRWKPDQKEETRRQIVEAASHVFRERGYATSSVSDVMAHAGLTVGGFYAHFESKERLLAEILSGAFDQSQRNLFKGTENLSGPALVRKLVTRYLSREHRDAPGGGCALPALAAEVGRQDDAVREEFERYLRQMVSLLDERAPTTRPRLSSKDVALAIVALSVGGLLLARAVRDESLSLSVLDACRRLAIELVEPSPLPRPDTPTERPR